MRTSTPSWSGSSTRSTNGPTAHSPSTSSARWAAMRAIRAARPDGAPIYVILDNLSARTNWRMKRWAAKNKVELCFTPTCAS